VKAKTAAIIVNWNNSGDTLECIRSLRVSSAPAAIIVVDNGSRRDDVSKLEGVKDIHLIISPENLGFGRGNNLGMKWAVANTNCDYVLLINNDATLDPTTLAELEKTLDHDAYVGIAAPRIVFADDPDTLWYGGGEVSWARGSVNVPGYGKSAHAAFAMTERDVTFASGCALLIRRRVIEQVGGFDPRYFMYEEDVEYCMRVMKAGWRIRYVPQGLVRHKVQGGRSRVNSVNVDVLSPLNPSLPYYVFHIVRNRLLTMHLHARGIDCVVLMLVFPLYLLKKVLVYVYYRRFDGISAIAMGVLSFWRERKRSVSNEVLSAPVR